MLQNVPQNYAIFFGAIVVAIAIVAVFVGFSTTDIPDTPIQLYLLPEFDSSVTYPAHVNELKINSAQFFYYPNPQNTNARDAFERFMLIRLPSHMGGSEKDISAFRAYSSLDPSSSCVIKYWPDPDRQRIEDPCRSYPYRAIDGIVINYPEHKLFAGTPSTGALPQLDLMMDAEGFLHVLPPVFTFEKNGIIGEGRHVTMEDFSKGTQSLKKTQEKYNKKMSDFFIPDSLSSGHVLLDLEHLDQKRQALYHDPQTKNVQVILTYEFCDCQELYKDVKAQNPTISKKHFWRVADSDIHAIPRQINSENGDTDNYVFSFYANGFSIELTTAFTFEEGMKIILENYFPEYGLNDVTKG